MSNILLAILLTLALIAGAGVGYIAHDAIGGSRTVTIQHKRAPCTGFGCSGLSGGNL